MEYSKHKRMVPLQRSNATSYSYAAFAIFAGSIYLYWQKIFRVNKNYRHFALFTFGSYVVAGLYGNMLVRYPMEDAAIINNKREIAHLR